MRLLKRYASTFERVRHTSVKTFALSRCHLVYPSRSFHDDFYFCNRSSSLSCHKSFLFCYILFLALDVMGLVCVDETSSLHSSWKRPMNESYLWWGMFSCLAASLSM
uniref:Secreted protein n=1 Tax=Panagrellus redivivus TaxID=6233 RepID=A0A7E4W422_PANRE